MPTVDAERASCDTSAMGAELFQVRIDTIEPIGSSDALALASRRGRSIDRTQQYLDASSGPWSRVGITITQIYDDQPAPTSRTFFLRVLDEAQGIDSPEVLGPHPKLWDPTFDSKLEPSLISLVHEREGDTARSRAELLVPTALVARVRADHSFASRAYAGHSDTERAGGYGIPRVPIHPCARDVWSRQRDGAHLLTGSPPKWKKASKDKKSAVLVGAASDGVASVLVFRERIEFFAEPGSTRSPISVLERPIDTQGAPRAALFDGDRIYVATASGLLELDRNGALSTEHSAKQIGARPAGIVRLSDGRIAVGTNRQGAPRVRGADGSWSPLCAPALVTTSARVLATRDGALWLSDGPPPRVVRIAPDGSAVKIAIAGVNDLVEAPSGAGEVWACTSEGVVVLSPSGEARPGHVIANACPGAMVAAAADGEIVWLLTEAGSVLRVEGDPPTALLDWDHPVPLTGTLESGRFIAALGGGGLAVGSDARFTVRGDAIRSALGA